MNDYICWLENETEAEGWWYFVPSADKAAQIFAEEVWGNLQNTFEFKVLVRRNGDKNIRLFEVNVMLEPEFEVYEVKNNLKLKKEA